MHDPTKFGDTQRMLEQSRDAWGWNWLDDATQDLKLGSARLMRAPTFAIAARADPDVRIGLNLTLIRWRTSACCVRPTLSRRKHWRGSSGGRRDSISGVPYPLAQLVASENTVLSAVLLENNGAVGWGKELWGVTATSFRPTGFHSSEGRPTGRLFAEGIDTAASPPAAVGHGSILAYQAGLDPNVVGRRLTSTGYR